MDVEEVLKLYDSFWFEFNILRKGDRPSNPSSFSQNLEHPDQENAKEPAITAPVVTRTYQRSLSEQPTISSQASFGSCSNYTDSSPVSPRLETIPSGKEEGPKRSGRVQEQVKIRERNEGRIRGRRRRKEGNKSLSELEFEELKGFMDLGFVFTEEDKDTKLVEIVPGLQRLSSNKDDGDRRTEADESGIPRPYLSEAWECYDWRRHTTPLLDFRIPASSNEFDIKDQLRWWAHAVASTVR